MVSIVLAGVSPERLVPAEPPETQPGRRIDRARLRLVAELLHDAKPSRAIVNACVRQFGCSEMSAWRYLKLVRAREAALELAVTDDERRVEITAMYRQAFEAARQGRPVVVGGQIVERTPDPRGMALAANGIARLHGAERPVEVTVRVAVESTQREIAERFLSRLPDVLERRGLPRAAAGEVLDELIGDAPRELTGTAEVIGDGR